MKQAWCGLKTGAKISWTNRFLPALESSFVKEALPCVTTKATLRMITFNSSPNVADFPVGTTSSGKSSV